MFYEKSYSLKMDKTIEVFSKELSEDEEKTHEKKVQTITDDHIKSVDEKVSLKEKEIMTIWIL